MRQDSRSSSDSEKVALVALPIPSKKPFLYRIPVELKEEIKLGVVVDVPMKGKSASGVVIQIKDHSVLGPTIRPDTLKEIKSIPDPEIRISPYLLKVASWMERYYLGNPFNVLRLFLPPRTLLRSSLQVRWTGNPVDHIEDRKTKKICQYIAKKRRPWFSVSRMESKLGFDPRDRLRKLELMEIAIIREKPLFPVRKERLPNLPWEIHPLPTRPTKEQSEALNRIERALEEKRFEGFLLYGVPGSGKTAVYVWAIEKAVRSGRSALVLVPEIALTIQMVRFFRRAFGPGVAVYHSGLTPSERLGLWKAAKRGEFQVILGPRSSVFLPMKRLGIIVVDEEHDPTLKEKERSPFYHARDVALMRGKIEGIPVILGSATPSLESFYNAERGKLTLLPMKRRVRGYQPAQIEIIDLKTEKSSGPLSIRLIEATRESLRKGKQVLLFLNRRGYAPHLKCLDCGYVPTCPHCQINLTFHKSKKAIVCHVCGYNEKSPPSCPKCASLNFFEVGFGTERAEEEIRSIFSDIGVERMDLDTTRFKGSHERIYRNFRKGRIQILLGTQMVAQGFDFPQVDLVGVLLADIGLGLPDFRAEERTFQILTQVSGRIRKGGRVLVQTFSPESPAIQYLQGGGYLEFQKVELRERREFSYPPFTRMVILEARSKEREKALEYIIEAKKKLKESLSGNPILINGPSTPPLQKTLGEYRFRLILRSEKPYEIQNLLSDHLPPPPSSVRTRIDVDPLNLL